jgi:hypothetical protein
MDLEAARKALTKRSIYSSKRVAFFGVVALCLAAGALLRLGLVPQPELEQNAPAAVTPSAPPAVPAVEATKSIPKPELEQSAPVAVTRSPSPATATSALEGTGAVPQSAPPAHNAVTAPTEQTEPTGEAVGEPEPAGEADEYAESELPGSGIILVAKQPVEVLASPSASAPALYGFPAGRPFRVIGREAGFAHIQDLKSSASGWIDEAALARPPRDPDASAPAKPKPFSVGRKPTNPPAGPKSKTTKRGAVNADSEVATQPDRTRPGLLGRGGLFGGIFGNGN